MTLSPKPAIDHSSATLVIHRILTALKSTRIQNNHGGWVENCKRAIESTSKLLFQRRHHSKALVYPLTNFERRKYSQERTDQHCVLYNSRLVEDLVRLSDDRYVDISNPVHPVQGGPMQGVNTYISHQALRCQQMGN